MIWVTILKLIRRPIVRETLIVIAIAIAEDFVRRMRQQSCNDDPRFDGY
jgi:hypothetical protein